MPNTAPELFDSHAHIDASEFEADRGMTLRAARAAGVREMLIPAIAASGWEALRDLCAAESGFMFDAGVRVLIVHARPSPFDRTA